MIAPSGSSLLSVLSNEKEKGEATPPTPHITHHTHTSTYALHVPHTTLDTTYTTHILHTQYTHHTAHTTHIHITHISHISLPHPHIYTYYTLHQQTVLPLSEATQHLEVNSLVISEITDATAVFHPLSTQICQSKEVTPIPQGYPCSSSTGRSPQQLGSQGCKARRVPERHATGTPTLKGLPGSRGTMGLTSCSDVCIQSQE